MRQRLAGAGAFEENFRAVLEAAAVVTLLVESPLELLVLLRSHLKLMFLFRKLGAALNEESGVLAAIQLAEDQIGRASCRERVCQYGSISVVAVSLKKKISTSRWGQYLMNKKL